MESFSLFIFCGEDGDASWFAVTPFLGFVTFRYRRRIKELSRQQRAEEGEIASLATEALSAIQVVKAFGSEDYEYDRVHERSELRRALAAAGQRPGLQCVCPRRV